MSDSHFSDRNFIEIDHDYRGLPVGLKIPDGDLNIFVGINNSGKSRILEYLNRKFGDKIDYISPDRLRVKPKPTFQFSQNIYDLINQLAGSRKSHPETGEVPGPDPIDEIVGLKKRDREILRDWHNKYFEEMTWGRTDEDNDWEVPTIRIGGRIPGEQGSGSRAVFSLLVKLFDPKRPILAIDEPELSVEPPTQKKLFELFQIVSQGEGNLLKKKIFIATHSHLFLDRKNIKNNFVVKRTENNVEIEQITTRERMYEVVLRLLGNSPTDLFFPSNIIVVEGPSDKIFLKKVMNLLEDSLRSRNIVFHPAKGESEVPRAAITITQLITTADYLPIYKERTCVLFDAQDGPRYMNQTKSALNDSVNERVKQLRKGYIELYYPKEIIKNITGFSEDTSTLDTELQKFAKEEQDTLGGFKITKVELAQRIVSQLSSIDQIDQEIKDFLQVALDKAYQ